MLQTVKRVWNQFRNWLIKPVEMVDETIPEINPLAEKLIQLSERDDLEKVFYSPVGKIYVIDVYRSSFTDLANNLNRGLSGNMLTTVNIYSYFNNRHSDLNKIFKDLGKYVMCSKIPASVEFDLHQLCDTFEILKGFGND